MGIFHENDNKEFIMLDSLGVEVFTIEMQLGGDIVKADIMREPVAFTKITTDRIYSRRKHWQAASISTARWKWTTSCALPACLMKM